MKQFEVTEEMCFKKFSHGSVYLADESPSTGEIVLENNIVIFSVSTSVWSTVCNRNVLESSMLGVWLSLRDNDVQEKCKISTV